AALIGILRRAHVTASFFNLGSNEIADAAAVRIETRDGFALGDHTWDHSDLSQLDAAGQAREIDRARVAEARISGHYTCLLRPPFGDYDATTLRLAAERHLAVRTWSVDPEDWKAAGVATPYWVHRIVARAEAGGTQRHPVVLLHNQTGGNPATVLALPHIIRYYRSHGYRFVDLNGNTGRPTVSRLSATTGSTTGGYRLVIRGANFRRVTGVRFGVVGVPAFTIRSPGRLVVTVPSHHRGRVMITVRTADHGDTPATAAARFRFVKQGPGR
ncbi:MAG TPA: polysaccharide deacetylase family protein, partial [Jatrophihabitans sp.]|nr:polysaccharide deacetylase family protein [Jatrophihabitans sp.]